MIGRVERRIVESAKSLSRRVVSIRQGKLSGVVERSANDEAYVAFRGIPYAKPPIGELRFQEPVEANGWDGTRDASRYGDKCAQFYTSSRKVVGSEDCLYLNVYTPSLARDENLPVMVSIHWGAFTIGAGDDDIYGPDYLMDNRVVLVTFNYRVGIFGFLNMRTETSAGNQGLKDQILALKWVQENISEFGGNPNNVTIFGSSAGGVSAHYLNLSPLSEGLFHKTICQSGVAVNPWASILDAPETNGFRIAEWLGEKSKNPEKVVNFLKTASAKDLVARQSMLSSSLDNMRGTFPFGPGVDAASSRPFMSVEPSEAARAGVKVPLLIGHNSHEGICFCRKSDYQAIRNTSVEFEDFWHPKVLERMRRHGVNMKDCRRAYGLDDPIDEESFCDFASAVTETQFVEGVMEVVEAQTEKYHRQTYFYVFGYDEPGTFIKKIFGVDRRGTGHADDLLYLFYPRLMRNFGMEQPEPGSRRRRIIDYFTRMWSDFARTGNPTPARSETVPVIWEPIGRDDRAYRYLSIDSRLSMRIAEKSDFESRWMRLGKTESRARPSDSFD